jgi:dipeptidyl aminopeptidase/acylaminoacyl peptidase
MVTLDSDADSGVLPETLQAQKLTDAGGQCFQLHGLRGAPYQWHPDGKRLLLTIVPEPEQLAPFRRMEIPSGPTIQNSMPGKKAPAVTYTDLLRTPEDEDEYEWHFTTQLKLLDLETQCLVPLGKPGMHRHTSISPDGNFLLVSTTQRPFSFSVPDSRFPCTVEVWKLPEHMSSPGGDAPADCWQVVSKPLRDKIPPRHDAVEDNPRNFKWSVDQPHTLRFVKALDGGDPRNVVQHRDQLFSLNGPPYTLEHAVPDVKLELRYSSELIAKDGTRIVSERRWQDRKQRSWVVRPGMEPLLLFDFSFEDKYSQPGSFVRKFDMERSRSYLWKRSADGAFFLLGSGASSRGSRPFVDKLQLPASAPDVFTPKPERVWRCVAGPSEPCAPEEDPSKEVGGILVKDEDRREQFENPSVLLGGENGRPLTLLFWRESQSQPPNLFAKLLDPGCADEVQLTNFEHPQPALCGVSKKLVKYKRKDGLELNATLYLPPGYDADRDGRLPCLMWAYPREFKSAGAAGQVGTSPYTFVRGHWSRPTFWLLRGYAVFDNFPMPVIGEGSQEPNDVFVEQLQMNAEAAVNAVVNDLKVVDSDRICVGGHSYGAFMTAHLLAHTNGLFRAGICRSGAYNRTLTPFGFQNEERSYWEATDIYTKLSPFLYAKQLAEKCAPLLLIHGQDDPNVGTYPMQSERFFQALKGHGAMAKLVLLPKEGHSYLARESMLHVLHEQDAWLQRHNAPRTQEEANNMIGIAEQAFESAVPERKAVEVVERSSL